MDIDTVRKIQNLLKLHAKHYVKTNQSVANFINSFYWELEVELKDSKVEGKGNGINK